ncbi:copper resistance protein CopC [Micromonospora sp. U56]|uniref:copper resistance CopC family protein n=1 Tax=Micromonospora sp. U56 TaxID=2824900 RepID=UPI0027DE7E63|nr:copper resistance protein CopC [Micromonospora sp. U56]
MALGVSLLLPATPAAAHNSMTGSDPADGARVAAAPARIELRFLTRVDPATTKITVVGPDNVPAAGAAPRFAGSRVAVPFRPGKAGLYIVGYQLSSSDGHPVKGEVRFTLTTGTPADPSLSPSPSSAPPSPSVGTALPGAATTAGPAVPAARSDDDGTPVWPWLVVAGLVVAGLGAVLLRRRATRS